MLMLVASAVAMEEPWDCFEATSLPELQGVDADTGVAWEIAWGEVEGWVDACAVPCEAEPDCWEAACSTSDGAVVSYTQRDTLSDDGVTTTSTSETWFSVAAPGGGAWSALEGMLSWRSSSNAWGTGRTETATLAWTGILDAGLPTDGAVTFSTSSSSNEYTEESSASWDDGACAWTRRVSETVLDVCGEAYEAETTLGAASGSVVLTWCEGCSSGVYRGVYDGVDVGTVDPETWIATGASDADGDGWFAEDGDCDDADAAVSPCGDETLGDTADGDCDGRVDDEDGDGWGFSDGDCDDADASVNPGAADGAVDGLDYDCDGLDRDADGDGHDAGAMGPADCNDSNPNVHADAVEVECDGFDQDCDGVDPCAPDSAGDSAEADDTAAQAADSDDTAEDTGDAAPKAEGCGRAAPGPGCGGSGMALLLPLFGLRRRRGATHAPSKLTRRDPCPIQVDAARPMPRPS